MSAWATTRTQASWPPGGGKAQAERGCTMTMATVNNGVNVQALLDAREALKGAPEAAQFAWRASCRWQNGTHSTTNVGGFFGLGQEQQHKTETSFSADQPEIFASEDK